MKCLTVNHFFFHILLNDFMTLHWTPSWKTVAGHASAASFMHRPIDKFVYKEQFRAVNRDQREITFTYKHVILCFQTSRKDWRTSKHVVNSGFTDLSSIFF